MSTSQVIKLALQASLMLMVLGLGLGATARDAVSLVREPGRLGRSFIAMSVVMPLLAMAFTTAVALPPAVRFALIALMLSPVPPFLPGRIIRAGGDGSYAVGLLTAASLTAILVIPVSVALIGAGLGLSLGVRSLEIARLVSLSILLPLAAGIAVRTVAPAAATRMARPLTLVSVVVLAAAFVPLLVATWPAMRALIGNGTLLVIVCLTLAGLAVGHLLGGPDPEDRTVLALATAMRHPAVATTILSANVAGDQHVGAAVLLALLVGAVASMPYTLWSKHHNAGRLAAHVPA